MLNVFKKNRVLIKLIFIITVIVSLEHNAFAEEKDQQTVTEIMVVAMKAYSQQDYEKALLWFDKAIEIEPNNPSLSMLRNEIALKVSDLLAQRGELNKAKQMALNVLSNPKGGLAADAKYRINSLDRRPEEGFHGYISTSIEYNSNVASSVHFGDTEPTNSTGYGNRPSISLGYQGHFFDNYYWDVWAEALPVFWSGGANNLDWQQYNTGVLMGFSGDLWDFSLSYTFSTDIFDSHLNRVNHGMESTAKFWVIPNAWQTRLTARIRYDDFRFKNDADATNYEISLQNYLPYSFGMDDLYSGYVYGGYTYSDYNASAVFGYKAHSANLMIHIPTPFKSIGVQAGGWIQRRIYDRNNPVDRKDTSGSAYVQIVKEWKLPETLVIKGLSDSLQTSVGYFYTETQSAADNFALIEHVSRFTVTYYF